MSNAADDALRAYRNLQQQSSVHMIEEAQRLLRQATGTGVTIDAVSDAVAKLAAMKNVEGISRQVSLAQEIGRIATEMYQSSAAVSAAAYADKILHDFGPALANYLEHSAAAARPIDYVSPLYRTPDKGHIYDVLPEEAITPPSPALRRWIELGWEGDEVSNMEESPSPEEVMAHQFAMLMFVLTLSAVFGSAALHGQWETAGKVLELLAAAADLYLFLDLLGHKLMKVG
jgi:hypothetical protein